MIKELENSTYLGDGVYVSYNVESSTLWLRTSNGISVTNTIALEPKVYHDLICYSNNQIRRAAPGKIPDKGGVAAILPERKPHP